MSNNLRECYRILEAEPGSSVEELRQCYRDLVKVWHPDRFEHDLTLKNKAQEKLKEINFAYERICSSLVGAQGATSVVGQPSNAGNRATEKNRRPE